MSQQLGEAPLTVDDAPSSTSPSNVESHDVDGMRETIEAIVFAFILAFLFRTFEAEAFVIPTGSMAPTLMGRHKDFNCPQCDFAFRVNAAHEVDKDTNARIPNNNVTHATCPNCRYTSTTFGGKADGDFPSYSGDRILANKLAYQFDDPKRWDVVLFKFPLEAKTNFIKRLVGLPGETIRIHRGDLFTIDELDRAHILRKPPEKMLAMRQVVYDNDHPARNLHEQGFPQRWQEHVDDPASIEPAWTSTNDSRTFVGRVSATEPSWLRYHNFVPSFTDWQSLESENTIQPPSPRPQLVTDYYAYNTWHDQATKTTPRTPQLGLHWVGDLSVQFDVTPAENHGTLLLELVEAGQRFQCHIDLQSGAATLSIAGQNDFQPRAETPLGTPGTHSIIFANFDDQLTLWVDNQIIDFDAQTTYLPADRPGPTSADLTPIGIGLANAKCTIEHLVVHRDLYYIATQTSRTNRSGDRSDYLRGYGERPEYTSPAASAEFFANESRWGTFAKTRSVQFTLQPDQFLCFGDNSPSSNDSRVWDPVGEQFFVPRELLIGKALCVYWPHAWETNPSTTLPRSEIRIPFYPNFARMKRIR